MHLSVTCVYNVTLNSVDYFRHSFVGRHENSCDCRAISVRFSIPSTSYTIDIRPMERVKKSCTILFGFRHSLIEKERTANDSTKSLCTRIRMKIINQKKTTQTPYQERKSNKHKNVIKKWALAQPSNSQHFMYYEQNTCTIANNSFCYFRPRLRGTLF